MRWGAEAQGVEQEAELFLGFVVADAQHGKDFFLRVGAVDTDAASAHLAAVEHQVVGLAFDALDDRGVGAGELVQVFVQRCGEGVVQAVPAAAFGQGAVFGPLDEGEVHDPEPGVLVGVDELQVVGELDPQLAEHAGDGGGLGVNTKANQVAVLGFEFVDQLGGDFGDELGDAGFEGAVGDLADGQAAGAELLDPLGQGVGLLAGEGAAAGHADGFDAAAGVEGAFEDFEVGLSADVADVDQLHFKAQVGAVTAEAFHGLGVRHAGELLGEFLALDVAPDFADQVLVGGHHVVLIDEGHLDVDLGELGLAVGTGVFVAEAASNLKILLDTTDHEDLFEELGALGQGVEGAFLQARGDQEVAGALGRAAAEEGGFDLVEALLVEVVAGDLGDAVARLEDVLHRGATHVEVAVLQPGFFADLVGFIGDEGGVVAVVEHDAVGGVNFDLAGVELGVFAAFADDALTGDGDDVFAAQLLGHAVGVGGFGVEDDLGDAVAVAQVDEAHAAVVAVVVDPAAEGDGFADVSFAQGAAGVGSVGHGGGALGGGDPKLGPGSNQQGVGRR